MEIKTNKVVQSNLLDLGKFGHAEEVPEEGEWPEPVKFPWFGVEVRTNPTLTDVALVDLLEASGEIDDKDPRGAIAVKQFVREVIHEDDFDDFWKLGKLHGYSTLEFAEVASRIIEAVAGDPTQGSADSSSGPASTDTKSQAVSSKVKRTVAELEGEGRPDLAEFYILAQEAGVSH